MPSSTYNTAKIKLQTHSPHTFYEPRKIYFTANTGIFHSNQYLAVVSQNPGWLSKMPSQIKHSIILASKCLCLSVRLFVRRPSQSLSGLYDIQKRRELLHYTHTHAYHPYTYTWLVRNQCCQLDLGIQLPHRSVFFLHSKRYCWM